LKRPPTDGKEKEKIMPIEWDRAAGKPTDQTNYAVLPGDRIFIRPLRFSLAPAVPPSFGALPTDGSNGEQIALRVAFVTDADGTMAEFGELKEHGTMIGNSAMALSMLKVLEKHKLVTRTSSPQLISQVGQGASVEVSESGDADGGLRVNLGSRRLDQTHIVVNVTAREDGVERGVQVALEAGERKTIIMKLEPQPGSQAEKADAGPAKYVFVTPEWVADGKTAE
jgi:hypothetical protein